jgi:uncharacterized phiE125 gp8 family phage protein
VITEIVTAPAIEPVSVNEAKLHCRVDHDSEDDLLAAIVRAATRRAELHCNRSFITQTRRLHLDFFPPGGVRYGRLAYGERTVEQGGSNSAIRLPHGPVQSVSSIQYYDTSGAQQTLSSSLYQLDSKSLFARVVPAPDESWPDTEDERLNAVTVTYAAGYGDNISDVPDPIRQAVLLMVGDMYAHRESIGVGTVAYQLNLTAELLLSDYRVRPVA